MSNIIGKLPGSSAGEDWRILRNKGLPPLPPDEVIDALVPFYGTPFYESLTKLERVSLYRGFLVFQCEAFITLENLIIIAMRKLEPSLVEAKHRTQLWEMLREEHLHGRAFRDFLCTNPELGWPQTNLFLHRSHAVKNILARSAKLFPRAVMLPSARLEIYTVCYADFVKRSCGLPPSHPWVQLHNLHRLDELRHIETDFDIFDATSKQQGNSLNLQTVLGMCVLTLSLHAMLCVLSWNLMSQCFPEKNIFQKFGYFLRFVKWNAKTFPPFVATRKRILMHFRTRKLAVPRMLHLLGW